jgi:hypothetical protein
LDAKAAKSVTESNLVECDYFGVNEQRLRQCVQEIRQGQCGTGIAQIVDCHGDKICPYHTEEGSVLNERAKRSMPIGMVPTAPTL